MNFRFVLFISSILLFSSVHSLQCGTHDCPNENACCDDVVMGPTCYDPTGYVCTSTGLQSLRLCGDDEDACGPVCYDPTNYFCCNGNLAQKGSQCTAATSAPTSASTNTPAYNCPSAGSGGVNCDDASLCCGSGTMTPSCLPADGSKQCCVWYLSSTQCNTTQVCGGNLGYGASSDATCGPAGSTFCNKGDAENAFCSAGQVCCGIESSSAWCCPEGNTCNTATYSCDAPTAAPTTAAPTTPTTFNCQAEDDVYGVNCASDELCCGAGTMSPSCLPSDGSKQCCVWYLSSTQCNTTEVCGGDYGYGASSYAYCGPAGSTFCDYGDGLNTFCSASEICCGNYGEEAWCCPVGDTCSTISYECIAPSK